MSWIEKIKDTDFAAALVAALPDRPNQASPFGSGGLTAQELKEHFDKAVIVVKDKLNALIDAIDAGEFKVDGKTTLSGLIASIKSGTFANNTLYVEHKDTIVSLQSALDEISSITSENKESIGEIKESLDNLLASVDDGTFASETLMVESVTNGALVHLRQALIDLLDYVNMTYNLLAESYNELGEEVYGTDPENPADGSLKKDVADIKNDLSEIPQIKTTPDPNTLAKRDENGRLRTNFHGDETSFKDAPDDEAVAMEDVRQFVPYDFVLDMDKNTYVLSFTAKNAQGDKLGDVQQVDLPLESVWISAAYDAATKSIVLTQRDGDPVYVDVAAITGGLVNRDDFDAEMAKKVDKITEAWRAYTTDANGNTVTKPLAAKPSSGGVVLYNEGGIVKTNAPVEDNDAANKMFVEDGLAGKVSKASTKAGKNIPWFDPSTDDEGSYTPAFDAVGGTIPIRSGNGEVRVGTPKNDTDAVNKKYVDDGFVPRSKLGWALYGTTGTIDESGFAGNRMVYVSCLGTQANTAVVYQPVTNHVQFPDDKEPICTIAVADPIKPIQAANKRYVDIKVDPIANDVAVIWDALGGAIEYASIDSTNNPVTVPSNVFPAATIDKIGTGIKTEVINEAVANTDPSEVTDGFSATGIEDGVYRLNGTFEGQPLRATFPLISPISLNEGEIIYAYCELLSGSITDAEGRDSICDIAILNQYARIGYLDTIYGNGSPILDFIINGNYSSVSFNDAIVAIHIGKQKQTYGVPVASVKKGDETIYTVPDAIRALTYGERPDGGDVSPVYGLAMSDTVYNYLDLEKKKYVVRCYTNFLGEIAETNATIDVSEYLTDEDGEITVAEGDEILFADADGNSVGSTVPSTITYIVKKGASQ